MEAAAERSGLKREDVLVVSDERRRRAHAPSREEYRQAPANPGFRDMQICSSRESVTKARGPPAPKPLSKTAGSTAGKIVGIPFLAGPQGHALVARRTSRQVKSSPRLSPERYQGRSGLLVSSAGAVEARNWIPMLKGGL